GGTAGSCQSADPARFESACRLCPSASSRCLEPPSPSAPATAREERRRRDEKRARGRIFSRHGVTPQWLQRGDERREEEKTGVCLPELPSQLRGFRSEAGPSSPRAPWG